VIAPTSTGIVKQLPLLLLGLAVLATVTILGYFGHVSPPDTLTALLGLSFLTGGLSLVVLSDPAAPNTNLAVHVTFALALVGAVLSLALHNVFNGSQVQTFLAPLIGTALLTSPANNTGNSTAAPVAASSDNLLPMIRSLTDEVEALKGKPPVPPIVG
jgi:hypothetical protein